MKHKKLSAKILSFALVAAMVVTALPGTVLAAEISLKTGSMTECHPVHDADCGYIEAAEGQPCSHLNEDGAYSCAPADADEEYVCPHDDECGYAEAVEGAPCTHSCEQCAEPTPKEEPKPMEEPTQALECSCTVKCTAADEENGAEAAINAECPVCGAENADPVQCKGEVPASLSGERTVAKRTVLLDLQDSNWILDKDGNKITASNGVFDVMDSEGWKFDSNTLTLTLNGANFEISGQTAIIMPYRAGAKIVLVGENVITSSSGAIGMSGKALTIEGDGTLTANSRKGCLFSSAGLIINGGTLNLNSSNSDAINVSSGDITISGGTLNLNAAAGGAIFTNGNITISGGTVSASGYYCGLQANGENIDISGGTVIAESSNDSAIFTKGNLNISDSADVTTNGYYCGLQANGSGIDISGGTVDATSSNGNAIFTKGTLNIDGNAEVTANGGAYCALKSNGNMTIGDSTIKAKSPNDAAIFTPMALSIGDGADITATGSTYGLLANSSITIKDNADIDITGQDVGIISADVKILGNAVVKATSTNQSAITGSTNLSITENADVTATGKVNGILSGTDLTLSAKNMEAYSEGNYAVYSTGDMSISGKLTAESENVSAIKSAGMITADNNANITATGGWCGIESAGDISFAGSTVEAIGSGDDGIYSASAINIDNGNIHAKGSPIHPAIRAESIQVSGGNAEAKISLSGLIEKNGGKVAFSDWNSFEGNQTSWTSFIAKDDTQLNVKADGSIDNALGEVWLAAPYTVTFDVNGTISTEKVYPNNAVTAPADPTKDGSHFVEWQSNGAKFDLTTPITADITLTATFAAHTPNADDGDCTTAITCSVCGEITTAAKTHEWDTAWAKDSGGHWHTCKNTDCTQMNDKAAHTFSEWVIDKAATETETGNKHRDCDTCEYRETVTIPTVPHTHTPSSEWSKDAASHWHNCTANDGERMDKAEHSWDAGKITKPATITQEGIKTYTCTVCGYERTEVIDKLPSTGAIVDDSTGTRVEYEDGSAFDSSIVLSVTSKPQAEMDKFKDNVEKAAPGLVLGGLYDVKLLKDGVAIQPDGKIKISIPLTDKMKSMTNLQIVYIDDNGNITIIPSEVKNDRITFVTDHLGNYGVIGKVKASDPGNNNGDGNNNNNNNGNGNTNSPQTGDSSPVLLFVLMILASGTALIVLSKKRKVLKHLKK